MNSKKSVLYPFWSAAIVLSILASIFCLGFASCDRSERGKTPDAPVSNSAKADKDADKDAGAGADSGDNAGNDADGADKE